MNGLSKKLLFEESGYIPLVLDQYFYRRHETSHKTRIDGIPVSSLITDQYTESMPLQIGCKDMVAALVLCSPVDDLHYSLAWFSPIEVAGNKELVE